MSEPLPSVSVVIITRDRWADLQATLRRVARYDLPDLEVVVVDNGSGDGTPERVRAEFPSVRVIALDHNAGIGGRNVGMRAARGEFLALQDDDSFFTRGSLRRALQKMAANPRLGAVAAREVMADTGRTAEFAHRWRPADMVREAQTGRESLWFIACGAVLRREALDQAGYFPEDFVWGHGEIDLATRLIICGWEVRYFPDVVAIHRKTSASRSADREVFYKTRNLVWYWWRYLPVRTAARKTAVRLPFDLLVALYRRAPRGYVKAVAALVASIPHMRAMRTPAPPELLPVLHASESELKVILEQIWVRREKLLVEFRAGSHRRRGG
ncbi:MAG: glycosyltransferase family 2 protein [Thermoleophilia bacterium]